MINETFQVCYGVGPRTDLRLRERGFRNWGALLSSCDDTIPISGRRLGELREQLALCQAAYQSGDLKFLIGRMPVREHWRVLKEYLPHATYFDIETSGLSHHDSMVTIVGCLHRGLYHEFIRGENLDEFLDLLDDVTLLVSFNGNSFDVPRILDHFHIPELPCPHVDLRWVSYHRGFKGGLKQIEENLGFARDSELKGLSGDDAVWLWQKWLLGCEKSRQLLLRYCRRDVESLQTIAHHLMASMGREKIC